MLYVHYFSMLVSSAILLFVMIWEGSILLWKLRHIYTTTSSQKMILHINPSNTALEAYVIL